MTRLMKYNGSLSVAVKEYKGNDLYEVKKEAGVIPNFSDNTIQICHLFWVFV